MRPVDLQVLEGEYAVWKLPPDAPLPEFVDAPFSSMTRTHAELSVVAPAHQAPTGVPVEDGWSCLEVQGPLAFELTGVLAAVSEPLATAGIAIFVVSTFDTDYVLVRTTNLERAVEALTRAGHGVTR
ncbi:MAG: ACT domain-containing protein [Acidobacteriota bacterium]|nr:ACT domain-containing protein [Acidobacteriota bacterium]